MKRTALIENSKNQILSNVRRLAKTDDRQPDSVKQAVLDQFARKALTSGYSLVQTRRIYSMELEDGRGRRQEE